MPDGQYGVARGVDVVAGLLVAQIVFDVDRQSGRHVPAPSQKLAPLLHVVVEGLGVVPHQFVVSHVAVWQAPAWQAVVVIWFAAEHVSFARPLGPVPHHEDPTAWKPLPSVQPCCVTHAPLTHWYPLPQLSGLVVHWHVCCGVQVGVVSAHGPQSITLPQLFVFVSHHCCPRTPGMSA